MKKVLLLISFSALTVCCNAQTWANAQIDINQAQATVYSCGDLYAFEVPSDSNKYTVYASTLWIGGLDAGSNLHLGAQTYRQSGNDFYPGPVMNSSSYSAATDAQWNQVWKINKTTIDTFLIWRANPGNFPSYVIPAVISSWPANGDVPAGQAAQLAPFIDVNGDNYYDPNAGDYPCIKGDQAIFFVFNDDRNTHGETGGAKMSLEFHGMLYAYSAPGTWLDSTVFLNYKMYNRSSQTYTNVYLGEWTDFDLGDYSDDFVGCDVGRCIAFAYNGDANDGASALPSIGTYGANPPAQGVVFLNGPAADSADGIDNDQDGTIDEIGETFRMSYHGVYNNDFTITGNPVTTTDYYGYLSGFWKDGSPWTYGGNAYGGSTVCDYMYPHGSDPVGWGTNFVPQAYWDEQVAGNSPGDRRSIASSGPFTLVPGEESCIDYAYVFGRGNNGPASSLNAMAIAADSARSFYQKTTHALAMKILSPLLNTIHPLSEFIRTPLMNPSTSSAATIHPVQ